MPNNVDGGMFSGSGTDYKHDCPRPLTGCDYPVCSCDVDELDISEKEINEAVSQIEEDMQDRDYEEIEPEDYTDQNS